MDEIVARKVRAMQQKNEIFVPIDINEYPKSNLLISAKYRSTLLENRLLAVSLAMSDQFIIEPNNDKAPIVHSISVSELRKMFGANRGSFYQQLNQAAASMTGKTLGMTSADSKTFDYIAVVTRATCKDGIFTIEYNGALRNLISDIKKNFSRLSLDIMLSFTNCYAFRLYELLKSKCYQRKGEAERDSYNLKFSLSELKLEMGVINSGLDSVQKVLRNQKVPDYDKAVEASPEKMFNNWGDFRRKVLEKAINEINSVSDLSVEFDVIKQGKGGKVHDVIFVVKKRKKVTEIKSVKESSSLSDDEKLEKLFEIKNILGEEFSVGDAKTIAEKADYDLDSIRAAKEIFSSSKSRIENPVGWMLSAVENGYSRPSAKPKHNFQERDYDFDALEKRFARN